MQTRTCPRCSSWFAEAQIQEEFSGICPKCLSEALTESQDVASLQHGTRFGGFEILEILGKGGMGVVYKARQVSLDRIVALKVLAPNIAGDPDFARRFDQEAKLLASVNHPNVVQVHDFGHEADVHFLVMEYVDGESLEAVFRRGGMDAARLTRVLRDVARGLDRIHGVGLVHRDLKPANILIARDGAAKIGDFGLAVGAGTRGGDQSYFIGSPHYVSPEHARGDRVDARSDLYALGVILYEGFEGRPPFQSAIPQALLAKHMEDPIPAMSRAPAKIHSLIRGLLQKAPADRPGSSDQVAESLDRLLEPRSRLGWFVGAAIVLIALAVGIWRLAIPARWIAPQEQGWTDLMKKVDLPRDRVSGNWKWDEGTILSDATERAKLMIPYEPSAQYDFRVFFSRVQGISDVNLILSKGGRSFAWCMGGEANTRAGFGSINGQWAPEGGNPSRVKLAIEPGIIYETRVEVRNSGVRAFLNGSMVCEWLTDYSDFSLDGPWSLPDEKKIGLGTFTSPTRFHGIQVREIP